MVKKINGWETMDAENETAGFDSLEKGAYIVKFLAVRDVAEKEYLEIKLDIADGKQKDFFMTMAKGNLENWSNQGIHRVSYKESAAKFFRAFITAVEKSNANKNYKWDWNENSLVNKYAVAVFREEEYLDNEGELRVSVKIDQIRSIPAFKNGEVKVPEIKKLKATDAKPKTNQINIDDDDLPF